MSSFVQIQHQNTPKNTVFSIFLTKKEQKFGKAGDVVTPRPLFKPMIFPATKMYFYDLSDFFETILID